MDIEVIPKVEMLVDGQLCCVDEELIIHYLYKKIRDQPFPNQTIHEVDFFMYHPQQLSQMHLPSQAEEWYFLSPVNKNHTEGAQSSSANNDGYWEPCGTESLIHKDGKVIGHRKTLIYVEEKHEKDRSRTEWLTHEYRLDRSRDMTIGTASDDLQLQWVVCKLYKLNKKLIPVEEKEATKSAGPNDGVSSKGLTIPGPENASNIVNDEGPSYVLSDDLHPLLDTDPITAMLHSSSILLDQRWRFDKPRQHDQGTVLATPKTHDVERNTLTPSTGPREATNKVVSNKHPRSECDSDPPPSSDQSFMTPNAKSQRVQGTVLPTPETQDVDRNTLTPCTDPHEETNKVVGNKRPRSECVSDPSSASDQGFVIPNAKSQRVKGTMLPTSTGPREANSDMVTDTVPRNSLNHELHPLSASSQGTVTPGCSEKVCGWPSGIFSFNGEWPLHPDLTVLTPFDVPFGSLSEEELAYFDMPDPGYSLKKEADK